MLRFLPIPGQRQNTRNFGRKKRKIRKREPEEIFTRNHEGTKTKVPKGRTTIAQGNALWTMAPPEPKP